MNKVLGKVLKFITQLAMIAFWTGLFVIALYFAYYQLKKLVVDVKTTVKDQYDKTRKHISIVEKKAEWVR